ncbi:hypothetical protein ENUP19_0118G0010 [Entamoeba nuttalli]|uniref:Uncharacterized protein n=1 Tax=Entamoeba nuttalli TaxID=412467 RepID=A0ABQ0DIC1_9EUKA
MTHKEQPKSNETSLPLQTKSEPIIKTNHPTPLSSSLNKQHPFSQTCFIRPEEMNEKNKKTLAELFYIDSKRNYLIIKSEVKHLKQKKKVLDKQIDPVYFSEKERINNLLFNKLKEKEELKKEYHLKKNELRKTKKRIF